MGTHSSTLAWRIPMDRGAWQSTVHRVAKSRTRLEQLSTHTVFCLQNEQSFLSRVHLGGGVRRRLQFSSLTSTSCFLLFCQEKCVWWRIKWEHWSPCKPGGMLGRTPQAPLCWGHWAGEQGGRESRYVTELGPWTL